MQGDCIDRLSRYGYELVGGLIHFADGPTWLQVRVDVQLVTLAPDLAHVHGVAGAAERHEDDRFT